MKILLLSFEYPPETGFGGIGTYTWYHARALARLGHDVHVLAGATDASPLRATEHDGVRVYRYRSGGRPMRLFASLGAARLWWTRNRLENAWSMREGLRALTRAHRYDVMEMPECGAEGLLLPRASGVPTVVRFHSPARLIMPFYDVRRADIVLCSLAEERAIRGADSLTSCSAFLAGEVAAELGVAKPIEVIPNGIDLCLFDAGDRVDFRRRFSIPADRRIVLFTGRMERRKGVHLLRDIATALLARHDVALVLAGQDLFDHVARDLRPHLEGRPLRGSFHHLGRVDLETVRSALSQCDVFLLPSLWENCPYSCLEAMAAGRAIVCSDQGGMPELVSDGVNGLLARSGDATSYVAAIERLLEDPALGSRLGAAARRTVEDGFTDVEIARRAVDHYTAVREGGLRA